MEKLIDQFEFDWREKSDEKNGLPEISADRASLLFILDTLNKHAIETDDQPVRKVREVLDQYAHEILQADGPTLHRVLFRFRQFFASFRMNEVTYVSRTFDDFRAIIWDFVDQLAEDISAEENEDRDLLNNFEILRDAVESNSINELKEKSRQFIDYYMEHNTQRETRRERRMASIKKNLDQVRKKLTEAHSNMRLDHLTKVYNRKSFDEHATQYVRLFRVAQRAITVVTIDIDHFKKINDNHGHPIGDFILQELGKMLKEIFHREQDLVARLGGEEFAVLLPDYTIEHATMKAHQALEKIRAETFVTEDTRIQFTVSMGIAQLDPHEDLADWMKRADQALYASKHSGRNRFTVAEPPVPKKDRARVA
jgi:diguanylate cyclase (GGDEF)-like protein